MHRVLALTASAVTIGVVTAVCAPGTASAQDADEFVAELRTVEVVYEDEARESGFLSDSDLEGLEDLAADLGTADATFDIAVLGSAVSDVDSEQQFAEQVLDGIGGDGRVVVLSPAAVGVASDLESSAEEQEAAQAAEEAATDQQSLTAGVAAAATALGLQPGDAGGGADEGESSEAGDGGGGSGAWIWLLLGVLVIGGIGLFWWSSRRRRQAAVASEAAHVGEGERKVRDLVEHSSQIIVELADRIDLAGTPVDAQNAFRQGAATFAELQGDLDEADTRAELEAVWPKLVQAAWELDVAKALSDGQPPPAQRTPGALFPPVVQPLPAPSDPDARIRVPDLGGGPTQQVPEAHYRQYDQSPFRGGSFGKALGVLVGMGMLDRALRPPSDRGWFEEQERGGGGFWDGSISGGGSSRPSSSGRSSRRINYGGRSRSVGRRRR